ncbi:hypothetical protein, partial [Staphylococcus aureus]|uniref:hypothetical protein n=1 Tax=Staphylococcus aureus TaxID=1280 RepID=UPI00338E332A
EHAPAPRRPTETIVVLPTRPSDLRPSTEPSDELPASRHPSPRDAGTVVHLPRPEQAPSVTHHLELVDQQLDEVLADLDHLWS